MRKLALLVSGAMCAAPALAQADNDPWEREFWGEATLVFAPGMQSDIPGGEEKALYDVAIGGSAERILQSGLRIGVRATLRGQKDHPVRPGHTGELPTVDFLRPAGAFSGLAAGPATTETGARGSLETAFVYVEGGYGELSLGHDIGVAARFHEGDVGILRSASPVNPHLDASGLSTVRTRPDLTGPAVKLSYVTPRLIGIRAGASFTPEADVRGLDRDLVGTAAVPAPTLENAIEIGVNAVRRFRSNGVRVRAGLSWSTADVTAPQEFEILYDDSVGTLAGGVELEWESMRLGFNVLSSDDGFRDGDYSAWSAGVAHEFGDWEASLTYGRSESESLDSEGGGFALAIGRSLGDHMDFSLAWQDVWFDPDFSLSRQSRSGADGIVFEITLRFGN